MARKIEILGLVLWAIVGIGFALAATGFSVWLIWQGIKYALAERNLLLGLVIVWGVCVVAAVVVNTISDRDSYY